MFLLIFTALFLFGQAAAGDTGQALALTIAGALSTFVMWGIKKLNPPTMPGTTSSLHGTKAFAWTVAVSTIITVLALWIKGDPALRMLFSGDFSNLAGLYSAAWSVVGVATAVYKFFMEKNKPSA